MTRHGSAAGEHRLLPLPVVADNGARDADQPTHKRRWYQFSLRTPLIVVTGFCAVVGWVAHAASVARERHAMRLWVERHGGWCGVWRGHEDENNPGLLRTLFGDSEVQFISTSHALTDDEQQQIELVFPDANLMHAP